VTEEPSTSPATSTLEIRRFVSEPIAAVGDAVSNWAAEVLLNAGYTADVLYLATNEAGVRESMAFWAAAQQSGLAFATPGAFPWTLANSPAGRISVVLNMTGPCTTLLGEGAWAEAVASARADVLAGTASSVLVVRLDPRTPTRDGRLATTQWELAVAVVGPD